MNVPAEGSPEIGSPPPLIEVSSVSFTYPESTKPAVDRVSLSVAPGEYLAILGANGSGKSSLLRLLNGQRLPDSGTVRVAGHDAADPAKAHAVRGALTLVFQSPPDQIVSSVVEEDVAFGPENLGLPRAEIERRVEEALEAAGLAEERRRPTHSLSAGQQQRLAIAGALAMRPACVAFDEATSMLDPPARAAVLDIMDALAARGVAVIHVTHDMAEAARAARVIVMEGGRVTFSGSPSELFASLSGAVPRALGFGLGLPPAARFALALGLPPLAREDAAGLAARIAARRGASRSPAAASETLAAAAADTPSAVGAAATDTPAAASSAPREAAFSLRGLGYAYLHGTMNETAALSGISFDLPRGGLLALVGRTGSGKSTLLQLLDGLAVPAEGRLSSLGVELACRSGPRDEGACAEGAARPRAGRAGRAGRAARRAAEEAVLRLRTRAPLSVQRPETALFERFSGDDVAFGPRNLGLGGKELVARVGAAMAEAGLPYAEFRDRPVRALSGGEKRRLALAGVLALEPEALLLDEPTAALDPPTKLAVLDLIRGRSRAGATIAMATHSMEEAAAADLLAVF
ncbi:MAG: ATP-binding cassette domain-containing protein, partial [Spirochaetaceae bacterium]|nr:ATP-binding cassette domain-containing protein [Spirochaetaceae bacterium]